MLRQWREAVPETQGAMVDAAQATHGDDSAGDGASLTGPQDNCVTEAHATARARGWRQGRLPENLAVRTTDASAWPGCSRSVASAGRRTYTPTRGDLPLTTQPYASWNLEGCCRPISHGGIPRRSRREGHPRHLPGEYIQPICIDPWCVKIYRDERSLFYRPHTRKDVRRDRCR